MMSRISGVKGRGRTSSSSSVGKLDAEPPTYGVDDVPDSILAEVRRFRKRGTGRHGTVKSYDGGKGISRPALSTRAIWSRVFQSCLFHFCDLVPRFPVLAGFKGAYF